MVQSATTKLTSWRFSAFSRVKRAALLTFRFYIYFCDEAGSYYCAGIGPVNRCFTSDFDHFG